MTKGGIFILFIASFILNVVLLREVGWMSDLQAALVVPAVIFGLVAFDAIRGDRA